MTPTSGTGNFWYEREANPSTGRKPGDHGAPLVSIPALVPGLAPGARIWRSHGDGRRMVVEGRIGHYEAVVYNAATCGRTEADTNHG